MLSAKRKKVDIHPNGSCSHCYRFSIRGSVRNALKLAGHRGYRSIAFPLIGSGGGKPERVPKIMRDELTKIEYDGEVRIVRFKKVTGKPQL